MPNPENPRMTESAAKPRMPLHWKIGIGFFLGLVLGLIVYYTGLHEWTPVDLTSAACVAGEPAWYCAPVVEVIVHGITRPFGQLFLSLIRSEEHTSELQSLMRISYAV